MSNKLNRYTAKMRHKKLQKRFSESDYLWMTSGRKYWKRYYMSIGKRWCRKQTNRRIRHDKNFYHNHAGYRKVFDMWWELY